MLDEFVKKSMLDDIAPEWSELIDLTCDVTADIDSISDGDVQSLNLIEDIINEWEETEKGYLENCSGTDATKLLCIKTAFATGSAIRLAETNPEQAMSAFGPRQDFDELNLG